MKNNFRKLHKNPPPKLVFNTDFDLEHLSSAGISRVLCYCESLSDKDIQVYILSSIYDYSKGNTKKLLRDNIYLLSSSMRAKYKIPITELRFAYYLKYNQFVKKIISGFDDESEITIVIYRSDFANLISCLFVFKFFKKKQVKLIIEKNELMTAIALNLNLKGIKFFVKLIRLFLGLVSDLLALLFDGVICISTRMENLYSLLNVRTIRIPILTSKLNDVDNYDHGINNIFKLAYFGNFAENKDMILSFINTFLVSETKGIQLDIYGKGSKDEIAYIKKVEKIDCRINYKGLITIHEMVSIMKKYDILLLLRKKNLQNQYGFSTKLAEYLSSGVPVLTTDFSDTKFFLKNDVNCFMVDESDIYINKTITKKIEQIMNIPYNQRKEIGKNGKETAENFFNPNLYSNTLFEILFN
jgi:glycosyltransferase involved in cell wall biosynthesis